MPLAVRTGVSRLPFAIHEHPPGRASALAGAVVAVGNFDGMHRGHQAVMDVALARGEALGKPVVMLTFEPHPRTVFHPERPVFRLTPPDAKARLAEAMGLDAVISQPFDRAFSQQSADAFVDRMLVDGFGLSHVVVGFDFHFGKDRVGTPGFLAEAGARRGFGVTIVDAATDESGETISSSRIRDALARGDLGLAQGLLGYRWFVEAEVIHGDKRGRTLGYPTANVRLPIDCRLRHGIYAVQIDVDGQRHLGVASYGRRPTFDDGAPLFETYVFDYSGDLYGKRLRLTLVSYLRAEMKFNSAADLVAQMDHDAAEARAVLTSLDPGTVIDRALAPDANA